MPPPSSPPTPTLARFNDLDTADAAEILGACLDIDAWVAAVCAGRPYPDLTSFHAAGAAAAEAITWEQCAGALARHPRIGERKAAVSGTETESAWSRSEQGGVQAGATDALAAGNAAYEERFGYIFLICAAGLSGEQILDSLARRMGHDEHTEQAEVMRELTKIALLRLAKAVRP